MLNSYEVQVKHYTDKINSEPKWSFAGIYADKGISGTSAKKRDEFMKMIRACKRHKIDMIITKSISRFSRNTLDCLKYIRILKEINVDVFFEEQGLHSKDAGAEFYITIYGSRAQSEAENISANVRWGKQQSAKEGKVEFSYNSFLGYKKGADGKPEIVEDEAKIIREIYDKYLEGDSIRKIADYLNDTQIKTPTGKKVWYYGTVKSILSNEKYKDDALINKTYVIDCISKKVKRNDGERAQYYVENNHPAIISPEKFNRVQEEMARRSSKKKVKQVGTKTELGKYSSKYALSELLICGECHTPYRRCTWTTTDGKKKIVWRCINRLDYGKKYCHHSPSVEESILQSAIVQAVQNNIGKCSEVLEKLKQHIRIGLSGEQTEDKTIDIQIEIARLDKEYDDLLNRITSDMENAETLESQLEEIVLKKHSLQKELQIYENASNRQANAKTRLDEIFQIIEGLKNHTMEFNDIIIRQIIDCVIVESKEKIKVVFVGGYEVGQRLCSD
ncbi:recombinase family protein [Ruminococcus sp.]|uniref:recombinase family protein n=1 Tax=Ruminococcus sp. TaxID=41978 RepID=UPI0025D7AE0C|nr:recombinase family protein [Ruminococcus sp.]